MDLHQPTLKDDDCIPDHELPLFDEESYIDDYQQNHAHHKGNNAFTEQPQGVPNEKLEKDAVTSNEMKVSDNDQSARRHDEHAHKSLAPQANQQDSHTPNRNNPGQAALTIHDIRTLAEEAENSTDYGDALSVRLPLTHFPHLQAAAEERFSHASHDWGHKTWTAHIVKLHATERKYCEINGQLDSIQTFAFLWDESISYWNAIYLNLPEQEIQSFNTIISGEAPNAWLKSPALGLESRLEHMAQVTEQHIDPRNAISPHLCTQDQSSAKLLVTTKERNAQASNLNLAMHQLRAWSQRAEAGLLLQGANQHRKEIDLLRKSQEQASQALLGIKIIPKVLVPTEFVSFDDIVDIVQSAIDYAIDAQAAYIESKARKLEHKGNARTSLASAIEESLDIERARLANTAFATAEERLNNHLAEIRTLRRARRSDFAQLGREMDQQQTSGEEEAPLNAEAFFVYLAGLTELRTHSQALAEAIDATDVIPMVADLLQESTQHRQAMWLSTTRQPVLLEHQQTSPKAATVAFATDFFGKLEPDETIAFTEILTYLPMARDIARSIVANTSQVNAFIQRIPASARQRIVY